MTEDGAQWVGDVARIQEPRGHLVEQRCEQVVVVLIEQDDVDRLAIELFGAGEAAEPSAHDHDPPAAPTLTLPGSRGRGITVRHR